MGLNQMEVSYSQLAVFRTSLASPFNDWTDTHVAQGFSWRPGSVSFKTIEQAGPIDVEVVRSSVDVSGSPAARIIVVPFDVDATGDIEVATITGGQPLRLAPGNYRLTLEHGVTVEGQMWARLSFESVDTLPAPAVLRADAELSPPETLLMQAEPA